jgi:hypothetical protein
MDDLSPLENLLTIALASVVFFPIMWSLISNICIRLWSTRQPTRVIAGRVYDASNRDITDTPMVSK